MNVLVRMAFQGTRYVGFQVQPNGLSVCQVFQDALQAVLGTRPDVKGCSRTDAGVHALGFALNFRYDGHIPPQKLPAALNAHLPMDIRVLEVHSVPEDFHARYAAHAKTYCYRIRNAGVDSPFDAALCCRIPQPLDLAAMQAAAAGFLGTHDFLALCSSGSSAAAHGDTVRTVTECKVEREGEILTITVTADGYLYNMVRILAGTLVEAGRHRLDPAAVPELLQSRDRAKAGPTLPARGLFLQSVQYDGMG
jgi:tRNA pseudouridine38-40 synthase